MWSRRAVDGRSLLRRRGETFCRRRSSVLTLSRWGGTTDHDEVPTLGSKEPRPAPLPVPGRPRPPFGGWDGPVRPDSCQGCHRGYSLSLGGTWGKEETFTYTPCGSWSGVTSHNRAGVHLPLSSAGGSRSRRWEGTSGRVPTRPSSMVDVGFRHPLSRSRGCGGSKVPCASGPFVTSDLVVNLSGLPLTPTSESRRLRFWSDRETGQPVCSRDGEVTGRVLVAGVVSRVHTDPVSPVWVPGPADLSPTLARRRHQGSRDLQTFQQAGCRGGVLDWIELRGGGGPRVAVVRRGVGRPGRATDENARME